jgi:Ca2+-binding RTX toxin-like protein
VDDTGTSGNDTMNGSTGDDRLEGGNGDDILVGGAGPRDFGVILGHNIYTLQP